MISAPDEVLDTLRALAEARQMSVSDIIREALAEKAATYRPGPRRVPRSLGSGDSGRTDISRRIGEEGFEPEPCR